MKPRRIGILGGSFDPIHWGHIRLAQAARRQLKLDQVIFIPAYVSPFKKSRTINSADHRLQMVRLAVKPYPWARVSDIEIKRKKVSYTYETLKAMRKALGSKTELFLILGSDAFRFFSGWKRSSDILKLAHIAVARRAGDTWAGFPSVPYQKVAMKPVLIASTQLRRPASQASLKSKVPGPVAGYIKKSLNRLTS